MRRFLTGIRASMALGRASRFDARGRLDAALGEYERGMALIGVSRARRDEGLGAIFAVLVVGAESLACRLGKRGPGIAELVVARDALAVTGFAGDAAFLDQRLRDLQVAGQLCVQADR